MKFITQCAYFLHWDALRYCFKQKRGRLSTNNLVKYSLITVLEKIENTSISASNARQVGGKYSSHLCRIRWNLAFRRGGRSCVTEESSRACLGFSKAALGGEIIADTERLRSVSRHVSGWQKFNIILRTFPKIEL